MGLFRIQLLLLAALPLLLSDTQAGTIQGTVRASVSSASQEEASTKGDNYQSRRYRFLDKVDYSKLTDFVVSIADLELPVLEGEPRPQASVRQENGTFFPHILPVQVGTEVEWPNRDDIFHNVFSMSDARQFDLGYYKKKDDAKRVVFDREGKVDVFCSIHSEMNCVVLVLPNPYFALADKRGRFRIENVPAGKYRIKAWHERLPSKFIEVTVPEEGTVELDIEMGLAGLPKI